MPPCRHTQDEIREELEAKEVEKKVSGMKTLISLLLNGEVMPKLLMTVIRFVVPCDDHKIKKLLLVYWEVVEKAGPDGKVSRSSSTPPTTHSILTPFPGFFFLL